MFRWFLALIVLGNKIYMRQQLRFSWLLNHLLLRKSFEPWLPRSTLSFSWKYFSLCSCSCCRICSLIHFLNCLFAFDSRTEQAWPASGCLASNCSPYQFAAAGAVAVWSNYLHDIISAGHTNWGPTASRVLSLPTWTRHPKTRFRKPVSLRMARTMVAVRGQELRSAEWARTPRTKCSAPWDPLSPAASSPCSRPTCTTAKLCASAWPWEGSIPVLGPTWIYSAGLDRNCWCSRLVCIAHSDTQCCVTGSTDDQPLAQCSSFKSPDLDNGWQHWHYATSACRRRSSWVHCHQQDEQGKWCNKKKNCRWQSNNGLCQCQRHFKFTWENSWLAPSFMWVCVCVCKCMYLSCQHHTGHPSPLIKLEKGPDK